MKGISADREKLPWQHTVAHRYNEPHYNEDPRYNKQHATYPVARKYRNREGGWKKNYTR